MKTHFTLKTNPAFLTMTILLLGVLLNSPLHAKTPPNQNTKTALTSYGEALTKHNRMLGTWALYEGDEVVFKQSLVPNDDSTGIIIDGTGHTHQYKIGSITKTFTAVIAFKFIEAGTLNLDSSLAEFFPDVANADKITIGQMLNHHSGIASYTDQSDFMAYYQEPQNRELMVKRINNLQAAFEPGEKAEYSNSNFLLLGYILSDISGDSYANLVQKHIVKPLELKNTYVGNDDTVSDLTSYQLVNESWQVIPPWSFSVAAAAGAVISTADDLKRFFRGLFKGELISQKSLDQMIQIEDGYGHGIFRTDFMHKDQKVIGYWHNGGIEGFASHATYYPSLDVTRVVLSNGLNKSTISDLNQALIDAYRGVSLATKIEALSVKASQLKPFTGFFQSDNSPLDIEVMLIDNQLMAQATGQGAFPLSPDSENRFTFAAANIEMIFNDDMTSFTLNQGSNKTLYQRNDDAKPATVQVDPAVLEQYTGVYASDAFPLDITVTHKDGQLQAQATGQGAFPLTAKSETEFTFPAADITMVFEADKQSMTFTQMGRSFEMQKKSQ